MESSQKKVGRVRPPRVQIQYEVQTGNAMEKIELPFVVGVMANLSGQRAKPLETLEKRSFVQIDRDNFHEVLARAAPRLAFNVPNRLTKDDVDLPIVLEFKEFKDFEPPRVAEQIPQLKALLDARHRLDQLLSQMEGKPEVSQALLEILKVTESVRQKQRQELTEDTKVGG